MEDATQSKFRIAVHGHRGARAARPENTLAGFEYAIRAGADAIELDVVVTADDVPVVWHDPVLAGPRCRGPKRRGLIRALTFSQVREWECGGAPSLRFPRRRMRQWTPIAALDEVLALARLGDFQFNIEIKGFPKVPHYRAQARSAAGPVVETIRRRQLAARVMVQSFDHRILATVRELEPGLRLGALHSGIPQSFTRIARRTGARIVVPYFRLLTPRRVRSAHAAGIQVIPWTVNQPRQWLRMVRAGVDGIITDDPAALIAWLRAQGLR